MPGETSRDNMALPVPACDAAAPHNTLVMK